MTSICVTCHSLAYFTDDEPCQLRDVGQTPDDFSHCKSYDIRPRRSYSLRRAQRIVEDVIIDYSTHQDQLSIALTELEILRIGWSHKYSCRCDTCKAVWKLVGPDLETDKCGPFTAEEINAE